jgi:hypothetical protein
VPAAVLTGYGPISVLFECIAGDVFQYQLWHDTGVALNGVVVGTIAKIG